MNFLKEMIIDSIAEDKPLKYISLFMLIVTLFLADGIALTLLSYSTPESFYLYGFIHASGVSAMVSPTLYLLLLRPMEEHIEERKKTEEILKKLSRAVENTADLVMITDKDGVIEYVNPSFERLTGYTKEDVTGKNSRLLRSGLHDLAFYKLLWEKVLSGEVFHAEFINMKKDGELYHEKKSIAPIWDGDGNITHFVATGKDITEQRAAEIEKEKVQAQYFHAQKMEAIGTLAGGVAHDFNNLMTATIGYSSLGMENTEKENPLHKYFHHIHSASTLASDLAAQLLLFSRKQSMELSSININMIIENIMKVLPRTIGENISIETTLEEKPWSIIANEGKIAQILMNLAVNAKDALHEGGMVLITTRNITIDEEYCKSHHEAKPGCFVSFSVSDTGTGIDKEIIPRIFEPFFTTKEVGKGTGLGLSVVYGIVKEHDGWMNVYSEPGAGTTFRIYLPAVPGAEKDAKAERAPLSTLHGGGRVLLVEDEKHVLEFVTVLLEENGYEVFTAGSAEEAMEIFHGRQGGIDLVISDVVLPKKDGIHLVEKLTEYNPLLKIILTSGYTDIRTRLKTSAEDKYLFIHKPYTVHTLLSAVKTVVETDVQVKVVVGKIKTESGKGLPLPETPEVKICV